MNLVPYAGWDRCFELVSGDLKAYITLEIGPRIIGLEHASQPGNNIFFVKPETAGRTDLETYSSYGGHRLLIGPELYGHVNEADNSPVTVQENGWIVAPVSELGWQRSIRLTAVDDGFYVQHRVTNVSATPKKVCAWTLSVVRSDGISFTPMPPFVAHPVGIEAAGSLVLWPYTDLSDPRYEFSPHGIGLRCADGDQYTATKYGMWVPQNKAGYLTESGLLFTKSWQHPEQEDGLAGLEWPDRGVNYEAFTRNKMLELESLGPLHFLEQGQSCEINETWSLHPEKRLWQEIAESWRA